MEIRQYKSGDEHKILGLFKICFGQEMSLKVWKWRFKNNPFTKEIFIYLMWEEDQLIGHYAVSPVEMKIDGVIVKTALSMTTMTHPEYGGRGVFSKLASKVYGDLKDKHGYNMVWGFPNNNSHYGFIKNLGWKDIAVVPMLTGKVSELRLEKVKLLPYRLKKDFDNVMTELLNYSLKPVAIKKSSAYLHWRYVANPTANYKIISLDDQAGLIVYKRIRSFTDYEAEEIDIMEISFGDDINNLSALLLAILKEEEGSNISQLNLWKSIFSQDRFLFEKLGFKISLPLTYLSFVELQEMKDVSSYKNWELGLGYSDVF